MPPTERHMLETYPKINGVYKRNPAANNSFIIGDFSTPELEYLAGLDWLWTEKVDGTNIRLGWDRGLRETITRGGSTLPYMAGRTNKAQLPPKLVEVLDLLLRDRIDLLGEAFTNARWATLYGEGYGATIQNGGLYRPEPGFVLFDAQVCDTDGRVWWLKRDALEQVAAHLGIDIVQVVGTFPIADAIDVVKAGYQSAWPGIEMPEGLVGRPVPDLFDRAGYRIMTKVKHRDFPDTERI